MKRICLARILMMICVLSFCVFVSVAHAAGATEVVMNQAVLNADTPYWVNGSTTAQAYAENWNAYFDAASSTLTLRDAEITKPHAAQPLSSIYYLLTADADLALVITGDNSIVYSTAEDISVSALRVMGDVTISGSGSLSIDLNVQATGRTANALASQGDIAIHSGNISISAVAISTARGIMCNGTTILITGGTINVFASANYCFSIITEHSGSSIRITGGTIVSTAASTADTVGRSNGICSRSFSLEGGTGIFTATGAVEARGLVFYEDTFSWTGGSFRFSGEETALIHWNSANDVDYTLTGGTVYVSQDVQGIEKAVWTSQADGILESTNTVASPFLFVQFGEFPEIMQKDEYPEMPQTGDSTQPLQWVVLAALTMVLASGVVYMLRRKQNEDE